MNTLSQEGTLHPTGILWLKNENVTIHMNIKSIYQSMEYGPAPESPGQAVRWLEEHDQKFQLFIGGKWQKPAGNKYFDSYNPATKDFLAKVVQAGPKDVDNAVNAAKKALPGWIKAGAHVRARYL